MKYLSVCSGIEAASVAWKPLGWQAVGFSEIERFPCDVLKYHYPEVPNFGDLTKYESWNIEPGTVDVLIGGTPCQSFSVAGLRKGLADPRGNLALVYLGLVDRIRPRYVVWENVPGVLSSNKGRDFGSFLGGLVELGYGFAYRVLDAQYWGVAQRRRRAFVVGCLDGWQRAASVLFEREGCTWNYPPRRQAGEGTAADVADGVGAGSEWPARVTSTLDAHFGDKMGLENQHINSGAPLFVPSWSNDVLSMHETGQGFWRQSPRDPGDNQLAVAYSIRTANTGANGCGIQSEIAPVIDCAGISSVAGHFGVRRLTPIECERLQGFPDGYTDIPGAKDGPRYKALGNSMAVPVIRWIGQRLQAVDSI